MTSRRFLLIGGCDGAAPGRNYYTDVADHAPADTVLMTLGCNKYRFNSHGIRRYRRYPATDGRRPVQ